ncbi:penicillin-binding transpeptidase domain-containing protein [Veillonella sp. CHU110]|uniref:penicillin-binding transpeptidase domain-containing protein n=1 Tax=Veillonella sp. CHU110 TaxID=2490947 RepID=UPI000F8EACF8|nr:penicillin-binding transpeptidase domain-containing protein [Veillonella sp. CHU110]
MNVPAARKRLTLTSRKGLTWTLILAIGLLCRYIDVQIIHNSTYSKRFSNQFITDRVLQSPRGTIYDRNGNPLALSVTVNSVSADPTMMRAANVSPEEVADVLAPYVRISKEEIIKKLNEDTAFVWIDRLLDVPNSNGVEAAVKTAKYDFIGLHKESRRYYPNDTLLAQVLGFVGFNEEGQADAEGKAGLEAALDDVIRSNETKVSIYNDAAGRPVFESVQSQFLPNQEKSVNLTIDTTVQFIAEQALDKAMAETKASSAAMIIMDPKTGEIIAMANKNKGMSKDINKLKFEDYRNNAVVSIYEPGSTFKPIIASSALAAGKWQLDTVYNDTGTILIDGHHMKNWDGRGSGKVRLLDILKYSINTGMAYLGTTAGGDVLTDYVKRFGFGKATGIELPAEGDGILFDPATMTKLDVATMSIGQGIAVTPLQMVQAFGALANGGKMMKPHIIKSIANPDGSIYKEAQDVEQGQPIPESIAKQITDILEKEVSEGGGHKAHVEGYQFAGKTGTAQKLDPEHGGYLNGRYIASFIGYGPVEDAKFVALVVIDDPEGTYYGSQIAAPVFQDVMTQLVRYYKLSPTRSKPSKDDAKQSASKVLSVQRNGDGSVIIPNFAGHTYGEVRDWVHEARLTLKPDGTGYATSQDEAAGSTMEAGGSVTVHFSR